MQRKINIFITLFFIALGNLHCQNTGSHNSYIGPEKGSLVIVGGGGAIDSIMVTFIDLAGGKDAPIVVIPTAGGEESYDQNAWDAKHFRNLGATDVKVLHTTDRNVANSEEFVKPLIRAKGVWFSGGRQWHLVDSYKNTLTEKMLWQLLDRNGVIGGSSAGATIQGSYLARGDILCAEELRQMIQTWVRHLHYGRARFLMNVRPDVDATRLTEQIEQGGFPGGGKSDDSDAHGSFLW